MTTNELQLIARILRIALGYGSRTARIRAMIDSTDPSVAMLAGILRARGYLHEREGTITVTPHIQP